MATSAEEIGRKIDEMVSSITSASKDAWGKLTNADINIPDAKELRELIAKGYEEGKVTLTTKTGEAVTFTTKQLQEAGIIETPGQLTPSQEKGRDAYETTKNMVTEQLAVKLKEKGNIFKIALLTGNMIKVPGDNDNEAYRKIANDLIEKREFTIELAAGGTKTITIADLDNVLSEKISSGDKDKQEQAKEITGILGGKTFGEVIPDQSKRHEIARSVQGAVEENTGNIKWLGGASIMNALMGLLKWIFSGFDKGFDGLKKSIADETAKSIGNDTKVRLTEANTGLNADVIGKIAVGAQAKAMEKAGYNADANTPVLPTLENTHLPDALRQTSAPSVAVPAEVVPVTPKKDDKKAEVVPVTPKKDDKKAEVVPVTPKKDDKKAEVVPVTPKKDDKKAEVVPVTPKKDDKKAEAVPVTPAGNGGQAEKSIDNIASKVLASSDLASPVSDKSMKDLKAVLLEQFKNNGDVKKAFEAGDYKKLSKILTKALIDDDRSYKAIIEATGKSKDATIRATAQSPTKFVFEYAAGETIEKNIKKLLDENGASLKAAIEQDSKHAFNDLVPKDGQRYAVADIRGHSPLAPNGASVVTGQNALG